MKAPAFWYGPRSLTQRMLVVLLQPAAWAFRLGGWLRAVTARPYRAAVPLICIGNAVAGGAGKTPMALALAAQLRLQGRRPVFVTRGYGGDGAVRQVDVARHGVAEVGDEALLLAASGPTVAGRDRVAAVRLAERLGDIILMDDGMQNPHLAPHATILVIDGESGIGNGATMPAGPLREPFGKALARAQAVIVVGARKANLPPITVPVFEARLEPDRAALVPGTYYMAFAGIGRPGKFYDTARASGLKLVATRDFADHHPYSEADAARLLRQAEGLRVRLLTTGKDAVRLPPSLREVVDVLPVTLVLTAPDGAARLAALVIGSCALQAQTLKP